MRRRSILRRRITSACAAVVAGSAIGLIPVADATPAATVDWKLQGEIDAYLRDNPGMTPAQAARAVKGQDSGSSSSAGWWRRTRAVSAVPGSTRAPTHSMSWTSPVTTAQ
jgi:hypothetical protein